MSSSQQVLHVGILSSPGLGHIIPALALATRLATHHNVSVTVFAIISGSSPAETEILKSGNKSNLIEIVEIPAVDISNFINSNTKMVTRLCVLVRETLPVVKSAISAMKHICDALIVDIFCPEFLPIAKEFGLPNYVYSTSTAWFTALTVYCPVLDKEIDGQYVDQDEPLKIPGCKSVQPEDVVNPMLDRNDQDYHEYLRVLGIGLCLSDGILMNTWEDAETGSIKALSENKILKGIVNSPVYPIGPLTRHGQEIIDGNDDDRNFSLNWLDEQTLNSVLYVSFGSGGILSSKQLIELAYGLELSQQKFIWIVRPPSDDFTSNSFFTTGKGGGDGTPEYLPEGFLSRTKDSGLVIQMWTDQSRILSHPSVGGFLSHCGWNSSIESITNGVPMIAWPLYAEQRQNATMLSEELGVAVRPEVLPTKKIVEREEIEQLVRTVMQYTEGKELRQNVKKLKMSAEKALNVGGSSHNSMCEVLKDIEKRIHGCKKNMCEETI